MRTSPGRSRPGHRHPKMARARQLWVLPVVCLIWSVTTASLPSEQERQHEVQICQAELTERSRALQTQGPHPTKWTRSKTSELIKKDELPKGGSQQQQEPQVEDQQEVSLEQFTKYQLRRKKENRRRSPRRLDFSHAQRLLVGHVVKVP